jgi:hypothetical protein
MIALNYRNNIYRIDSRTSEDSTENYVNPKVTYWFDIRNGVSFEYGLTLGDFQRSPDLVGHIAMSRYTYRFNPRTSIFGEYTQLWRHFDNPSFGEPPSIDYVIYRPSIGIEHAFSQTLTGRAQLGYYWVNPEKGSTLAKPFYDILLTQRVQRTTYTLSFQGGYTEDFFDAENLGFTQYYRTLASVTHQLLQRMTVGLFSSYEWIKSQGAETDGGKQKDRIWTIGGNTSYQLFKWLIFSLEASHRENHSSIDDADYSEYRGVFRVTATY